MRLSRDDILKAEDLTTEEVATPEWGGTVLVRGMSGRERDQIESASVDQRTGRRNLVNMRAKIAVLCIVDDDGQRVFDDADFEVLGGKSAAALDRVFDVAARLSGMGPGDVEEMTENFGQTPSGSSSSPSPPSSAKRSRVSSPK